MYKAHVCQFCVQYIILYIYIYRNIYMYTRYIVCVYIYVHARVRTRVMDSTHILIYCKKCQWCVMCRTEWHTLPS